MDCLFCKIIAGEIPAKAVYQDDLAYVFADIHPQAPTHLLVLPRKHIPSLAHTGADDKALMGHLLEVAVETAKREGLTQGFRTVINSGRDGGQTVDHLHLHVLGGRAMHWPPG
jgi:histidine triad (HIT) family protein